MKNMAITPNQNFCNMEKEQLIEQIEQILKSYYNTKNGGFYTGCYVNGHWLSVDQVVRVIENNLD